MKDRSVLHIARPWETSYRGGEERWQIREELFSKGIFIFATTCSPPQLPAPCKSLGLSDVEGMSEVRSKV